MITRSPTAPARHRLLRASPSSLPFTGSTVTRENVGVLIAPCILTLPETDQRGAELLGIGRRVERLVGDDDLGRHAGCDGVAALPTSRFPAAMTMNVPTLIRVFTSVLNVSRPLTATQGSATSLTMS